MYGSNSDWASKFADRMALRWFPEDCLEAAPAAALQDGPLLSCDIAKIVLRRGLDAYDYAMFQDVLHEHGAINERFQFWTDASCPSGPTSSCVHSAVAVVVRADSEEVKFDTTTEVVAAELLPPPHIELMGIRKALVDFLRRCEEYSEPGISREDLSARLPWTTLEGFCDCYEELQQLVVWPAEPVDCGLSRAHGQLLTEVVELLKRVSDLGVEVLIHWVPGHTGVSGNEKADKESGRAAAKADDAAIMARVKDTDFRALFPSMRESSS
ncbi:reverse transcriptase [Neofusicoccum parvum]|nr:reverse transcriptase [Neofusicoccum parvum]